MAWKHRRSLKCRSAWKSTCTPARRASKRDFAISPRPPPVSLQPAGAGGCPVCKSADNRTAVESGAERSPTVGFSISGKHFNKFNSFLICDRAQASCRGPASRAFRILKNVGKVQRHGMTYGRTDVRQLWASFHNVDGGTMANSIETRHRVVIESRISVSY